MIFCLRERDTCSLRDVWREALPMGAFRRNDLSFCYFDLRDVAREHVTGFLAANSQQSRQRGGHLEPPKTRSPSWPAAIA